MARVIIVTPDIVGPVKNGGIGTACYHYARTLALAGHEVDILFCGPATKAGAATWRAKYRDGGIGFWTLNDLPAYDMIVHGQRWHTERSWAVMQFLRTRQDDYVLFQDWHANGFWSMRAKRMGLAFASTTLGLIAHSCTEWQNEGMGTFGDDPVELADLAWAERRAISEADILVSPSRHMIEWLSGHGVVLPDRVALCPYTFEDPVYPRLPPPDLGHLLFFGRLETRKGLHVLGQALRGLAIPPRRVSLLGKYAQVEGVPTERYIEQLRYDLPSVSIEAHTDLDYREAVAFIRAANGVVVMPSLLDNLPLTVIECITNGFHFIASDVGGIPEMADPAVLFAPNPASLGAKLAHLSEIDFAGATHLYSPDRARATWLDHVASTASLPAPAIPRAGPSGVSVCIPFYKHDRYLKRVVNSFLRMARPDVQLVFVNDGTPEAECPLFHQLAARLEPLGHVFHTQANTGPGGARNRAVSLARHDRVMFFDSDNVAFPDLVARLETAQACSGADIVAASFLAVPPMAREPVPADAIFCYRPPGGSLALGMIDNMFGDTCALWRRRDFEALGGFRAARFYIEDWELYIRAAGRGYAQLVYPLPLFYYTHEDHERRQTGEYVNRTLLWDRLGALEPGRLAEVARVFIRQHHAQRR